MTFSSGNKLGTGVLLKGGYLLTAAHNYHSTTWSIVSAVDDRNIQCGVGTNSTFKNTITSPNTFCTNQVRTPSEYSLYCQSSMFNWLCGDFSTDYALVKICPQTNINSPFRLPSNDEIDTFIENSKQGTQKVNIAGYPAQSSVDNRYTGGNMFHGTFNVSNIEVTDEGGIIHYINAEKTAGGLSGSPVWFTNKKSEHIIIGIHVSTTSAAMINKQPASKIRGWIQDLNNVPCKTP